MLGCDWLGQCNGVPPLHVCEIKDYNCKVKSVCLISMSKLIFWVLEKHAIPCYFEVK